MKKAIFALIFGISLITEASAATTFEKAIWIPYWRKTEGASTTLQNLSTLTQISPFAFELQPDGTIKNALKFEDNPWPAVIAESKSKKIKMYPSILSYPHTESEKYSLYLLLAQRTKRYAHEKDIVALVKKYNVDGIDIDYEAKLADDRPYFSAFLKELATLLHKNKKQLICTIEARTPPESKFARNSKIIISKVEYSNDYLAIGKVCDQVRIMAYDQAGADRQLVNQNQSLGNTYKPVADIDWVEKVATLALREIPAKKIILGIPTYGYKYEIIPATATTSQSYSRIGSMNFNYADELARSLRMTPIRNATGEISFTYGTTTDIYGNPLGSFKQYLVWYSDATAIAEKIKIAKLYKLGGVVIFKVDGGNDPKLWSVLK